MTDDDEDRPPGPFDRLRELIEALQDLDDQDDAIRFDYDYDVRVGLGGSGDDDRRRATRWNPATSRDRDAADRERTVDAENLGDPAGTDRTYHVDVQERDDELVVTADLPGVDEGDIEVEVDDDHVRVEVEDETVERVPVAWDEGTVTDVSFRNEVLVVTLRADRGGDADE